MNQKQIFRFVMSANRRLSELMNMSDDTDGNTSDEYQPSPSVPSKRMRSESTCSSAMSSTIGTKRRPTRQPKCFSKNAMMARENRLKKKMYIESLEKEVAALKAENKKIASLLENQSFLISDLRKEIRYLKSILANSADISKLIRSIHQNTGMSVSTSLDHSLTLKQSPVSKQSSTFEKKTPMVTTWDENSTSLPGSEQEAQVAEDNIDMLLDDDVLRHPENLLNESSDILPLGDNDYDFSLPFPMQEDREQVDLKDHSYSIKKEDDEKSSSDDVGVCLHVSNHRVSLEFCPTCSENAANNWNKIDENWG